MSGPSFWRNGSIKETVDWATEIVEYSRKPCFVGARYFVQVEISIKPKYLCRSLNEDIKQEVSVQSRPGKRAANPQALSDNIDGTLQNYFENLCQNMETIY